MKPRGHSWALFVCCVLVVATLLACKNASGTVTNGQLGTLQTGPKGLALKAPASTLPRVAGETGDISKAFGVCFDYTNGAALGSMVVVVHTPGPLKTVRLDDGQQASGSEVRLPVPALSGSGNYCQDMYFDDDDPLGTWKFDLEQDGKSLLKWQLEVVAP